MNPIKMAHIKLILSVIVAVLGLIIVLQNTESVQTRFFFWSVTMPRAVLIVGTMMIGFALGTVVSYLLTRKDAHPPLHDTPPPKALVKQDRDGA